MNQEPQFKIHGHKRRTVKRKYNKIKSFLKDFWHYHNMDKDMCSFYGGSDRLMSDEKAQEMYDKKTKELEDLEKILSEPYKN